MNWLVRSVQIFAVIAMLIWGGLWLVALLVILGISQTAIESFTHATFRINGYANGGIQSFMFVVFVNVICPIKIYTYYRLLRLFEEFAAKRYFSMAAIKHMRIFAGLYTLTAFASLVLGALIAGKLFLRGSDMNAFLFGLIFLIITQVLTEARKVRLELDDYF